MTSVKVFTQPDSDISLDLVEVLQRLCAGKNLALDEVRVEGPQGMADAVQHHILELPTVIVYNGKGVYRLSGEVTEAQISNILDRT